MKKPTRFERMVEKVVKGDVPQWPAHVDPGDAVMLLTREHRAVLRHVNTVLRKLGHRENITSIFLGQVAAYAAMRDWLQARAR